MKLDKYLNKFYIIVSWVDIAMNMILQDALSDTNDAINIQS